MIGPACPLPGCFAVQELGLAMGGGNMLHAVVGDSGVAHRLGGLATRPG